MQSKWRELSTWWTPTACICTDGWEVLDAPLHAHVSSLLWKSSGLSVFAVPTLGDWYCYKHVPTPHPWSRNGEGSLLITDEHSHPMPSAHRWDWWTYPPYGPPEIIFIDFRVLGATEHCWWLQFLRWVRLSWNPWLLKSPGYMRISAFIVKEKRSRPDKCRRLAPNVVSNGSNTKKWNYILPKILLFYNQSLLKLVAFICCSSTSEKGCNSDKLCH